MILLARADFTLVCIASFKRNKLNKASEASESADSLMEDNDV